MKSILTVDETWTINSFPRLFAHGVDILQLNGLPFAGCPYASIAAQLEAIEAYYFNRIPSLSYNSKQQVSAIKSAMQDTAKVNAVAGMSPSQFINYQNFGLVPGNLIIPADLVDERTPIPNYLQMEIFKQTELSPIQELLLKNMPALDIPYTTVGTADSSNDWYWKPTGEVTVQVEGDRVLEIPCYPDSIQDSVTASWSQEMTTYQHYEPQNTFKQSGPRVVSCQFKIHRAMWDGNQDSGKSEELVAYLQSACYPDYDTQAAEPPRVTLLVGKSIRIVGILTSMDTRYYGPIGPDTKYDCVDINISITEESDTVLSTAAVRSGLAGWR